MRRAQPPLTVSLLMENYPVADPDWLESIQRGIALLKPETITPLERMKQNTPLKSG
jgi:hypothetical protein